MPISRNSSMGKRKTTIVPEWIDEYYQRHEYIPGEEKLADEWLEIKPELENGDIPYDLDEFFTDARQYFEVYEKICMTQNIEKIVDTPAVPCFPEELKYFSNDRFLSIKKDVVRAMASILDKTSLLGMPMYKFLMATDDEKLNIAGGLSHDQDFQLFLIDYVGLRVDFENLFDYFYARSIKLALPIKAEKGPEPINPWLADLILKYRIQHSDATIREEYLRFCEHTFDKSWEHFLAGRAMLEESKRNPIILEELSKSPLPERTKDYLSYNCAINLVADLLQVTVEELNALFEERPKEIPIIEKYLEKLGLKLCHCDKYTYKLPFPEK